MSEHHNSGTPALVRRAAILATCLAPLILWIAPEARANAAESSLDSGNLSEVVVTARRHYVASDSSVGTKSDIPLIETPQSISVVTLDEIQLLGMQNLEQATRYTSGIVSGSYGGDDRFDWLTLRGFTPTEYLDGLRLPSAAVAEAQSRLDIYALQEIEILKGPASSLYGQVPPGGIVNMVSKRPSADEVGEAQVELGNYNFRQVAFDSSDALGANKDVLYRVTGLLRDTDQQVHYDHDRRALIAPSLTWLFAPGGAFTFLSHYQDDHTGTAVQFLPAQGTLLPNPNGQIPASTYTSEPNYDTYHRREWDAGYDFNYVFNPTFSVHETLRYTDLRMHYNTVYGGGFQADLETLNRYTYLVDSSAHNFAVDTHARAKLDTGPIAHDILVGIDYFKAFDNSAVGFGNAPSLNLYAPVYGQPVVDPALYLHTLTHQQQYGFYVQDHAKIGHWAVTLNAREDKVTTSTFDALGGVSTPQDDRAFSGRAGVDYLFESGIAPYLSVGKSFTPTIGTDFTGRPFIPTNGVQYEAGVKFQPSSIKGLFTVAAYQLTQQHALTPDPDPAHLFYNVQTGEVRVRGFEAEGVTRLNDNLSINVAYTYTSPIVTKSTGADLKQQVPLVPRNSASALVDYTIRGGFFAGLGFGGGIRYTGNSYGDTFNQWESPPFTLLDAIVHYDTKDWHVALNVNNLLDHRYVTTCGSINFCYLGSQRTEFLTMARRF